MTTCEEVRFSLGVYVLGALEPAERITVDSHVGSCPVCRDELASLAGMPALLGRVSENQIAQLAGPPEELLDSLLSRAADEREADGRARSLRGLRGFGGWAPLAAAAAVLLVLGALFGGLLRDDSDESPQAAPTVTVTRPTTPSPSTSQRPPAEKLSAAEPRLRVSASLAVWGMRAGTKAELHLKGVEAGTRCRLDAVTRNGRRDSMGAWEVVSKGYTAFYGSSMFRRDQIVSFQIVTEDGRTLLTIPA